MRWLGRLSVLWLLLGGAAVWAEEEVRVAAYGQRDELTLRSDGTETETRVGRLGVTLTGIYGPHVEGDLDLGYSELTQTTNPATQGMSLTGGYLGVALRLWPLRGAYLGVWLQGDYSYHAFSGSISGQSTDIDWHDRGVTAGLVVHLGVLDLHGAVRRGRLSGEEIARGTLTYTRDLERKDETSAWAGLDLHVDAGGTIGVVVERGGRRSLGVRFGRSF